MTVKELIQALLEEPLDNVVCDSSWEEIIGIDREPKIGQGLNRTYLSIKDN